MISNYEVPVRPLRLRNAVITTIEPNKKINPVVEFNENPNYKKYLTYQTINPPPPKSSLILTTTMKRPQSSKPIMSGILKEPTKIHRPASSKRCLSYAGDKLSQSNYTIKTSKKQRPYSAVSGSRRINNKINL